MRKIIHIDMDAFYASVEQRDFPELKGKAVVVGRLEPRSVVATASYEARKYGIHSAMPSLQAKRLCPDLHFQPARFCVYREVSAQIQAICKEYTDLVEPLSLDEAYLDVTVNKKNNSSATQIALGIKEKIKEKTCLTASAGVSYNKFLSKIASDYNKPDGLLVIEPSMASTFLKELRVDKFYGVGEVTARKMHQMEIYKGDDLLRFSRSFLIQEFGKAGNYYYDIVRGIDQREVVQDRKRKSFSVENTYEEDVKSNFGIITELYRLEKRLFPILEKSPMCAKTVCLKVRYSDFSTFTKSKTFTEPILTYEQLHIAVAEIRKIFPWKEQGIRLLGLGLVNLQSLDFLEKQEKSQLCLF
ncbi:MAG: DNA polymerase IV [Bacteroidales bacterium]